MRFYRVTYCVDHGSSAGYSWHTSRREASTEATKYWHDHPEDGRPKIQPIDVEPTKAGILAALNL
jgi:hypothetical protein